MRILIKFTEVHEYSLFTPYEFGGKLLWIRINEFYFIDIVDSITSYGVGTILYFKDSIEHIVHPNEFYIVGVYPSDAYWNAGLLHRLLMI